MATTGLLVSALPGSAEEPSLKLSVTPEETKAGAAVEVSSVTPCKDEKDTGYIAVVDVEVWFSNEIIASDTVTAYAPGDPAHDGDWSWTYQTTTNTRPGGYTVAASCFLLDTDAVPPEPSRRHLGDYGKTDFLVGLDTEVHPSDPSGPPNPSGSAPIGAGYGEAMEPPLVEDAPPPATPVPARPTFAG